MQHHPLTILHLSDLHFGVHSRFVGEKPSSLGAVSAKDIKAEMKERAEKGQLHKRSKIDLVIVTGDVAETAHPSEYENALEFFQALREELMLAPSRLVIIPGNHDVSWAECKKAELDSGINSWTEQRLQAELNKVKLRHFHCFLSKLYGKRQKVSNSVKDLGGGGWLFEYPELRTSLAAINSCERESHRVGDHFGDVSKPQLEELWKVWQRPRARSHVRIVALHHNPTPPIPDQVESLRKELQELVTKGNLTQEILDRYLTDAVGLIGVDMLRHVAQESQVQLVLHGHHHVATHGGSWSWQGHGVGLCHVLAAGAWGAAEIPGSRPAVMQVIEIDSHRPADEAGIRSFVLEHRPYERGPKRLERGVWHFSGTQLNLPAWNRGDGTLTKRGSHRPVSHQLRHEAKTATSAVETIRVSIAALVRLEKDGRYLLIRNLHRPEMFAPFGGVFKYSVEAITFLKDLGYQLERPYRRDLQSDVEGDLRGYISRVNFSRFVGWFSQQTDREDASTCLRRELFEELTHAKAPPDVIAATGEYTFKLIRSVDEGPRLTLQEYKSYRHIEMYEPDYADEQHGGRNREITNSLFRLADFGHPHLLVVDKPALARLRFESGQPLAGTVDYFFSAVRRDHEPIPFGRLEYSSVAEQQFSEFLKSKKSEVLERTSVVGEPILLHAVKKHFSDSLVARLDLDGIPHIIKFYPEHDIYVRKERWALEALRKKGVRVPRLIETHQQAPAFTIMEYVNGMRLSECAVSELAAHISGVLQVVSQMHKVKLDSDHYGEIIGEFTPVGNHRKLSDYVRGHVAYWRREINMGAKPEQISIAGISELLKWADQVLSTDGAVSLKSALSDRPCLCHSDVKTTDIVFDKIAGKPMYCLLDFDNVFAFLPEFDLCKLHFNLLDHGFNLDTSEYTRLIARHYRVDVASVRKAFISIYPFVLMRLCNWAVIRNDTHLIRLIGSVVLYLSKKEQPLPDAAVAETS